MGNMTGSSEHDSWALGLKNEELELLKTIIDKEFKARNIRYTLVNSGLEWSYLHSQQHQTNLGRFADECSQTPREQWPRLVSQLADQLLKNTYDLEDTTKTVLDANLEEAPTLLGNLEVPTKPTFPRDPSHTPPVEDLGNTLPARNIRSQEVAPTQPPRQQKKPAKRSNYLMSYLVVSALVATFVLEIRAYIKEQPNADINISAQNEVLLEARPAGQVIVLAERDGIFLGHTPMRFLISQDDKSETTVLLVAQNHIPKRVKLPNYGRSIHHLERIPSDTKPCHIKTPPSRKLYQAIYGEKSNTHGELKINGAAVVRTMPEGSGAWIVKCPSLGGQQHESLMPKPRQLTEFQVVAPKNAWLYVDNQLTGRVPQFWQQFASFAKIQLQTSAKKFVTRYVPATGQAIQISMPANDNNSLELSVPNTDFKDIAPRHF